MGLEIQVDTLEDLCALMCDNVIPKRKEDKEDGKRLHIPAKEDTGLLDMAERSI